MRFGVGDNSHACLGRGKCLLAKNDGWGRACIPFCLRAMGSADLRSSHTSVTLGRARYQGLALSSYSPNSFQSLAVITATECLNGLPLLKLDSLACPIQRTQSCLSRQSERLPSRSGCVSCPQESVFCFS